MKTLGTTATAQGQEGCMPRFYIETEREDDGRWIAEIPTLPGVMAYGNTQPDAVRSVQALALHVLADRINEDSQSAPAKELVVCLACAR